MKFLNPHDVQNHQTPIKCRPTGQASLAAGLWIRTRSDHKSGKGSIHPEKTINAFFDNSPKSSLFHRFQRPLGNLIRRFAPIFQDNAVAAKAPSRRLRSPKPAKANSNTFSFFDVKTRKSRKSPRFRISHREAWLSHRASSLRLDRCNSRLLPSAELGMENWEFDEISSGRRNLHLSSKKPNHLCLSKRKINLLLQKPFASSSTPTPPSVSRTAPALKPTFWKTTKTLSPPKNPHFQKRTTSFS